MDKEVKIAAFSRAHGRPRTLASTYSVMHFSKLVKKFLFMLLCRLKYENEGELFLDDCVGARDVGHTYMKPNLD
jgi:hypothetical protein